MQIEMHFNYQIGSCTYQLLINIGMKHMACCVHMQFCIGPLRHIINVNTAS